MKQLLIFLLLTGLFYARSNAQVSVNSDGSAPDNSAMLDVKSANKGLLIPRVALIGTTDATTIPSPATSLLIYNTATAGTSPYNVTPGYYYWSGTAWVRLSVNAGGSGTTNYLPKWNSSGMLGNSLLFDNGTNVGVGTSNPLAPLQVTANSTTSPATNGLYVFNPSNTTTQNAIICTRVGGSNAGDPFISIDVNDECGWAMGIDNSTGKSLSFRNNWDFSGTDKMTLTDGGNVGIGTTTPSAKLDIYNPGENNDILKLSTERAWIFYQEGNSYSTSLCLRPEINSKNFKIKSKDKAITYLNVRSDSIPSSGGVYLCENGGNVGIGTTSPAASAALDITSTTKGLLIPRMTLEQISGILTPSNGLQVFCTTNGKMYIFVSTANQWKEVAYGAGTITPCNGTFTDSRDGKVYSMIAFGSQCWMKENLNYASGESCCYDNNAGNCAIYGRLYNFFSYSNPCPSGWHVPDNDEWSALTSYISSQPGYQCNNNPDFIAKAMAANTLWAASSIACTPGNNLPANNATGFSGLPGGYRYSDGSFYGINEQGSWFSLSACGDDAMCGRRLYWNGETVANIIIPNLNMVTACSVRCTRDN
jgi:uncharacterized protein (TIGR02145 family)